MSTVEIDRRYKKNSNKLLSSRHQWLSGDDDEKEESLGIDTCDNDRKINNDIVLPSSQYNYASQSQVMRLQEKEEYIHNSIAFQSTEDNSQLSRYSGNYRVKKVTNNFN